MRPYWKGYLKLALVSCPIALHAACSTAERIAFRQVNKATGNRLRQQLLDEETGVPVAPQDRGRGYEVAKGHYLIVADEELDAIEIESTHTIEIDSFVPRAQIDQRFFDTPYYITPNEPVGQQAFAVIREAMRGKRMVALGPIARLRSSSLRHGHSRSATVIRSCWKSRNACPLCHSLAKAWSIGRSLRSSDGTSTHRGTNKPDEARYRAPRRGLQLPR